MTLMEKTHELGEMIKNCPEMQELKRCEAAQAADEEAQALMKEFNLKRMNLVRDMQSGKITREEATKSNNEAFEELVEKSPSIKAYVEAKKDFDAVVQEVNGVLNYYITGQEPGCTHDCGSCGGCH